MFDSADSSSEGWEGRGQPQNTANQGKVIRLKAIQMLAYSTNSVCVTDLPVVLTSGSVRAGPIVTVGEFDAQWPQRPMTNNAKRTP